MKRFISLALVAFIGIMAFPQSLKLKATTLTLYRIWNNELKYDISAPLPPNAYILIDRGKHRITAFDGEKSDIYKIVDTRSGDLPKYGKCYQFKCHDSKGYECSIFQRLSNTKTDKSIVFIINELFAVQYDVELPDKPKSK